MFKLGLLILVGVVGLGLLLWSSSGLIWDFGSRLVQSVFAGTGLTIVLVKLASSLFPNAMQLMVAWIGRTIPLSPGLKKKITLKNEIEGRLNGALAEFGREGAGFTDHRVVIEWVGASEERLAFFSDGNAIVKLDYSQEQSHTLVDAALLFCRGGLLPHTRQFVNRSLMRAIDIVFIDEILVKRFPHARTYLLHDVVPHEEGEEPQMRSYLDRLWSLSRYGWFTRIFLAEL